MFFLGKILSSIDRDSTAGLTENELNKKLWQILQGILKLRYENELLINHYLQQTPVDLAKEYFNGSEEMRQNLRDKLKDRYKTIIGIFINMIDKDQVVVDQGLRKIKGISNEKKWDIPFMELRNIFPIFQQVNGGFIAKTAIKKEASSAVPEASVSARPIASSAAEKPKSKGVLERINDISEGLKNLKVLFEQVMATSGDKRDELIKSVIKIIQTLLTLIFKLRKEGNKGIVDGSKVSDLADMIKQSAKKGTQEMSESLAKLFCMCEPKFLKTSLRSELKNLDEALKPTLKLLELFDKIDSDMNKLLGE